MDPMAKSEESSPLLKAEGGHEVEAAPEKMAASVAGVVAGDMKVPTEWTVDGVPLTGVVGVPVAREQWDSGLFSCLGRNDDFCSSDLEVCLLGSVAPCMLYGSNVERLGSGPGSFTNSCLLYTGLYMLGNSFFGWNFIAPWFSYPSRTAIRRRFNLEGSCEALSRSYGCCSTLIDDEEQREQIESTCDFLTHLFCHPYSLCQEGRELRRRLPHPAFNGRLIAMMPPMEQRMRHTM